MSAPRPIVAAALVALVLRLAAVLAPGLKPPGLWEDARIAMTLARGGGFAEIPGTAPTAVKGPPYPFLLAPLAAIAATGDDERGFVVLAGLLNAILGAGAVMVSGRLGTRLFGSRAGTASAWILALYPAHVYLARVPEATSLSLLLFGLALAGIVRAAGGDRLGPWLAAGGLAGLAVLSNPVAGIGLAIACVAYARGPRRIVWIALWLAACALVVLPWTVRNHAVFGRLVAVKSPLWNDVYQGLEPHHLGGRQVLPDGFEAAIEPRLRGLDEVRRDEVYRDAILPWMRAHPGTVARLTLWRVGQLFCLYGQRPLFSPAADLLFRTLPAALLAALAAAGFVRGLGVNRTAALVLGVSALSYVAVYALVVASNTRYHLELAVPLVVLAGAALGGSRPLTHRATGGGARSAVGSRPPRRGSAGEIP